MPLKIPTVQVGLEKSIQKAVKNVSARGGLNLSLNDRNFTRPLGKITGAVSEFNKSLEASNARVLAFGASVGIIQGVQSAFKALLQTTIQVEKQLTEINIVMGLTNSQLDDFSKGLFKVAKNTAQSFSTVATAATELARQGLTMEETLKRTNDALILTRLTGLDAASAVSGLTAALNTFNKAGLDSTKILSKMAAVDVQFAVSTEDLIDAVSRAGAVAQDAGVSFDQLLGAVTAAQQQTARGGKVIGNSFKTIFTRVQRSSTINRLEELGIAVRDIAGNTLPAITVLENLSRTYETLADTTKAAVAEQVGGVFQINILKAAIKDLAEENSILARATQIAASATDEAYKKNEILNRSLSALVSQSATSIKELANLIGDIGFSDQIRDYLTVIRDSVSGFSDFLGQKEGESAGADFAKGLIKGIGNVISGPGLFLAGAVLIKLFAKTSAFLVGSAKELMGVVSASQKQKRIQESIVTLLGENSNLQRRILSQEGNRAAQEKTILTLLQAQSREQQRIAAAAKSIGPAILRAGFNTGLTKGKSEGHIPNYVSAEERMMEKQGARSGGYTAGSVRSMNVKGRGRVVYNTAEKVKKFAGLSEPAIMPPKQSSAGKKYQESFEKVHGFNPYFNKGMIPNYAKSRITYKAFGGGQIGGPPRQVNFTSTVGNKKFTEAQTMEIPVDGSDKMGLQVIFTGDSPVDMRGRGYGRELYEYMAGYAKKNGYAGLYGDMGTSPSAMRVIDSIAKRKTFKVEKAKDLQFFKDDFETEGMWGSDNWTYRLSSRGSIPNYALSNTPVGSDFLLGLSAARPASYKESSIAKFETYKDPTKLNDLLSSPQRTLEALKYLDNKGLDLVKESMLSTGLLSDKDWELVKQGVGKKPEGDVGQILRKTPARELLNYMVGNTDRISGNIPGTFLRLLDKDERDKVALDMIGRTGVSGVIKRQVGLMSKSKNRMRDAQLEVMSRDVPRLTYNPERGITKARSQGYLLAQMYRSGNPRMPQPFYPDTFIDSTGQIKKFRRFGDFSERQNIARKIREQRQIEAYYGAGMAQLNYGAALNRATGKNLLLSNISAGKLRNNQAVMDFEEFISRKEDPISTKQAIKKIAPSITLNKDLDNYFKKLRARSMKRFGFSEGMIPNFGMRIDPTKLSRFGSRTRMAKIRSGKHDGVIGMSRLREILGGRLFTSIKYKRGSGEMQDLFLSGARSGVHKYKKGAKPPKKYDSWGEMDLATGTKVVHANSAGIGEKGYRRLKLNRIESVVSQGKHLKVDPDIFNKGMVPNFMLGKMRTVAQAVGMFKKDTGLFSALSGKNFWSRRTNAIKLRESNYDEVRQFINSRAFRSLPDTERNRIIQDLRAQSEALNLNDVTRSYFQYGDPDYEGRIHASSGAIPNYANLFSGGASKVLSKNPQYGGAVKDAIAREASFGLTPKVVQAPSLKSSRNPGLAVVNQEQEGGMLSNARKLHGGLNPNKKSSAVPNYAIQPVGLNEVIQSRVGAIREVEALGLDSVAKSAERAANTIDELTASSQQAEAFLNQQSEQYTRSAELIKENNLREKARLGTLKKESVERQRYMRETFRRDALGKLAGSGGPLGDLARSLQGEGFEANLRTQMGVAQQAGDVETLKGLERLNEALDRSAEASMSNPETTSKLLENSLRKSSRDEKRLERFRGTKGFDNRELRKFFAEEFLQARGVKTKDTTQALSVLDSMGPRGKKAFQAFVQEQGVLSSNRTLARGGLRTGQFGDLLGEKVDGSRFLSKLEDLQSRVDSGEGAFKTRDLRKELMSEAARIGKDDSSTQRLQTLISDTERERRESRSERRSRNLRGAGRDRIAGGRFGGSFLSGLGGSRVSGGGFFARGANRFGRGLASVGSGARAFGRQGFAAAGGQVGLGLAIGAPMLAGVLANQTAREDRATLRDGRFEVEGRGRDAASSTLMGVGMGAIAGLPGAIAGGFIGFIASMKKATLTIDEQVRVREKEIALIGQNMQATQTVKNLSSSRAQALASGDMNKVADIDTAMNRALAGVTDQKTLKRLASSGGDLDALAEIQRDLQDQMTNAVSVQNFGVALKNSDQVKAAKNAGVAMGAMIAQAIRNEDIDESSALEVLRNIQTSTAAKQDMGMLDTKSLNALRKKAEGAQGFGSTGTLAGAGIGAAGLVGAGMFLSSTGIGLPVGLALAALGGGLGMLGGRSIESSIAEGKLEDQQKLGLDEITELSKLVDAGAMTETAMQQLVAAFREGEISMGDIAQEAEKAVLEFQKIKKASDRASAALFNIDQTFKRTISKMAVSLEVDKIRSGARSSVDRSNANFSSQFMSGKDASSFLARRQSEILANDASARISQFSRETDIGFLRDVKSKSKNLNFGGPQMEFIRKTVEESGVAPIESMVRSRKMDGVMNLNLDTSRLDSIFELLGVNGGVDAFDRNSNITMPENINDLKELLGTSNKEEQSRIVDEIIKNLPEVRKTGEMQTAFSRELAEPDAKMLTEILDGRKEQFRIIQEQILAERKNLSVQIAQNKIQSEIQGELELLQREMENRAMAEETKLVGIRGRAQTNKSLTAFKGEEMFRGMNSDSEESDRQAKLRKQIFEEDMKVRKAEALNTLKREAQRILSEKNLINALNNLKNSIDEQLNEAAKEGDLSQGQGGGLLVDKGGQGGGAAGVGKRLSVFRSVAGSEKINDQIQKEGTALTSSKKELKTIGSKLEQSRSVKDSAETDIKIIQEYLERIQAAEKLYSNQSNLGTKIFMRDKQGNALRRIRKDMRADEKMSSVLTPITQRKITKTTGGDEYSAGTSYEVTEDAGSSLMRRDLSLLLKNRQAKRDDAGSDIAAKEDSIEQIESDIKTREEKIKKLEEDLKGSVVELSDVLKGQNISLEKINIVNTKELQNKIQGATNLEEVTAVFKSEIERLGEGRVDEVITERIKTLTQIMNSLNAGLSEAERSFNVAEAQRAVEDFNNNLNFSSYSKSSFDNIRGMNNVNIRSMAGARAMSKVEDQVRREQEFELTRNDPTATKAEIARAEAEMKSRTIGTKDQRDRMAGMRDSLAAYNRDLVSEEKRRLNAISTKDEDAEASADAQIVDLKEAILELDASMEDLALEMTRTTPRDKGFLSEFSENTSTGLKMGFAEIEEQSEQIYTRLGRDLPMLFRDGLVDAMQAAIDGSQSLEDSFRQIGITLLQNIQRAFLTSASNRITGAVGNLFGMDGYNAGGYVNGGSGTKDDVPAMLMGGEYVIKKSAVDKYGVNFLENLNSGTLPGFKDGGGVNLAIGAPMVAERERYIDKNKYGNVTRYKTTKAGIGISSQLSAYAINNDRSIQKYFRDQEEQFNQDITTRRQEKQRQKQKEYQKKVEKNQFWNMIIGVAGSALLSKAISFGVDKYNQTDFAKNRSAKSAQRSMDENGYANIRGRSINQIYKKPSEAARVRSEIRDVHRSQGWQASSALMRDYGIGGTVDEQAVVLRNRGGAVPSRLTGGEYVMSPSAVKTYGSTLMQGLNSGSVGAANAGGQNQQSQVSNVSHGDVNISINVDSSGGSAGGTDVNSSEFASKVKSAVMQVISKEKRVGGTLR